MITRNVTKQHVNHPHGTPDAQDAQNRLRAISTVVGIYVAIVTGTIAALGILSATAPHLATQDAWVHAVIVAVFAVVFPLRLRAARACRPGALRAVGIISAVLFLVNVTDDVRLFPLWMRAEMIGIARVMAVVIVLVARERVRVQRRPPCRLTRGAPPCPRPATGREPAAQARAPEKQVFESVGMT